MSKSTKNQQGNDQDMVISYLTIRKAVGWLGILLPPVIALGTWLLGNCPCLKDSVSAYYYTTMGSYFSGTLCAVGLFLFSYKGYDRIDRLASRAAAVFALGVVFLPTNVSDTCACCNIVMRHKNAFLNAAHYTSAALFFITVACMSLFLFTKTAPGSQPTKQKLQRNKVYKICGYVMLFFMVLIVCLQIKPFAAPLLPYKPEFWFETMVLCAFGISWLTKGEALLKDK